MKDQVKEMYDQIMMPEESVQKIRKAMAEKTAGKSCRKASSWPRLAAVAAILALVLVISPTARAAVNTAIKYIFPESGITVYEETNEKGEVTCITVVDTEAPPFAEIRDGRLYFTGNGENIDITDLIEEDRPYYYTYVDDYGLTHYMVVAYSGTIENFGIYEFMREVKEGQKDWEGWSTGSGRNDLNPETESAYPWVEIVWEELDIPWPMPGT